MREHHEDFQTTVESTACSDSKSYPCDSGVFDLDLPAVEKLAFIAITGYYHLNNRRPTLEELARDIGCSKARAAKALEVLSDYIVYNPEPTIIKA